MLEITPPISQQSPQAINKEEPRKSPVFQRRHEQYEQSRYAAVEILDEVSYHGFPRLSTLSYAMAQWIPLIAQE